MGAMSMIGVMIETGLLEFYWGQRKQEKKRYLGSVRKYGDVLLWEPYRAPLIYTYKDNYKNTCSNIAMELSSMILQTYFHWVLPLWRYLASSMFLGVI